MQPTAGVPTSCTVYVRLAKQAVHVGPSEAGTGLQRQEDNHQVLTSKV